MIYASAAGTTTVPGKTIDAAFHWTRATCQAPILQRVRQALDLEKHASDKKGRRDGKCILSLVLGHNALLSAEQADNGDDTLMNLSVSNGYGGMCLSDLSLSRLSSLWESSDGIEPGSFILHDSSEDYAQANVRHKMHILNGTVTRISNHQETISWLF